MAVKGKRGGVLREVVKLGMAGDGKANVGHGISAVWIEEREKTGLKPQRL
jgi:hypothetical protein